MLVDNWKSVLDLSWSWIQDKIKTEFPSKFRPESVLMLLILVIHSGIHYLLRTDGNEVSLYEDGNRTLLERMSPSIGYVPQFWESSRNDNDYPLSVIIISYHKTGVSIVESSSPWLPYIALPCLLHNCILLHHSLVHSLWRQRKRIQTIQNSYTAWFTNGPCGLHCE